MFLIKTVRAAALAAFLCFGVGQNAFASSLDPSPMDISLTDWNSLLKYQIFAQNSLTLGHNETFDESTGFIGTNGNISGGGNWNISAPMIAGGNISSNGSWDTLQSYAQAGGDISFQNGGTIKGDATAGGSIGSNIDVQGTKSANDAGLSVPTYTVPSLNADSCAAITACATATNYGSKDLHNFNYQVDVSTDTNSVVDLYYNNLRLGNVSKFLIKTRPGQLVRVFVKNELYIGQQDQNPPYDASKIGISNDAGDDIIASDEYTGNLMVFVGGNFQFGNGSELMGTYVTPSTLNLGSTHSIKITGQLLVGGLTIGNDWNASDFNFVPFDPPEVSIPIANNGYYMFYEDLPGAENTDNSLRIRLDKPAVTQVTLTYHFEEVGTSPKARLDDDFATNLSSIYGYYTITIAIGDTAPASDPILNVENDAIAEQLEPFKLVFDGIDGAIFPNFSTTYSVDLAIDSSDNANPAPTIDPNQEFWVFENETSRVWEGGAIVGGGDTVNGTTPAVLDAAFSDAITYSIQGGGQIYQSSFKCNDVIQIDAGTGELSVNTAFDFEQLYGVAATNEYCDLQVRTAETADLNNYAETTVRIYLLDVNEAPTIDTENNSTIAEDSVFGAVITTSDPEDQTLVCEILEGPSAMTISWSPDRCLYQWTPTDGDEDSTHAIQIRTYDPYGLADTTSFSITVTNVNDTPVINSSVNDTTAEDTPLQITTDILTITDPDNSSFSVIVLDSSNYTVTSDVITPAADFNGTLYVPVRVTDGTDTSAIHVVTVVVTPVDDAPVLVDGSASVAENSAAGTLVTTISGSDVDGDVILYHIISGNDEGIFDLDPASGEVTIVTPPDYETTNSYSLVVTASSNTPALVDTATFTISITNVNEAPVLETDTVVVDENSVPGTVVDTLEASDVDTPIDSLVFTVNDPNFEISPEGILTVADSAVLDYESTPEIEVIVSVSDGEITITDTITVSLSDVNENPSIITDTLHISENEYPGVVADTLVATDPDGDDLTYSILTPDSPFQINAGGGVSLIPGQELDFEAVPEYEIIFQVNDGKGGTGNRKVIVTVDNVVENSDVEIVLVSSPDTSWSRPDTIWTNAEDVEVTWDRMNNGVEETVLDSTELVSEGIIQIIRSWADPTADNAGSDTVWAVVNREEPELDIQLPETRPKPDANTIVEEDTTSEKENIFYTNKPNLEVEYVVEYVDENLKTVTDTLILKPDLEEGPNEVIFEYEDVYGNTVIETVTVVLDTIPPVVEIIGPEDSTKTKLYVADIEWTVDGVLMDELTRQSLNEGDNMVVRTFRDKAGNEASDTIYINLKERRTDLFVALEDPLVEMDDKRLQELYDLNPPEKGEVFALSVYNVEEQLEQETLFGSGGSTKKADGDEPYPGTHGRHLGPTLRMEIKVPHIGGIDAAGEARGGTLGAMMEEDGRIAVGAGTGTDRELYTVKEYIENFCLDGAFEDINGPKEDAALAETVIDMDLHIYDHIGQFVDKMKIKQVIDRHAWINDAGVVTLYLEIKPDETGKLHNQSGRSFGTGAYILRGVIRSISTFQCDVPDAKAGQVKKTSETISQTFGYKR